MGVLKDLETFVVSTGHLRHAGIPSVSMAFLDDPLSPVQHHVMSRGDENAETVYQACSISKAITALAVAKLVDRGKITYDTKVIDHIPPPIATAIVDDSTRHLLPLVTVGMLLSHRSGLSQHGFPGYVGEPANYQHIFEGQPPSNTPRIRFNSLPGSQYIYSGGGFTLLQIVIEQITWTPFADFMHQTVLGPLGMSRSKYGDTASGDNNYARAHVTAYTPGTSSSRGYYRFTELAAAGLWTTPSDLLKATAAIQRSLFSKDGFLTPQTARKMLTLAAPKDPNGPMGMGWAVSETFFGHSGQNDPGYTCYIIAAHRIHDVPKPVNNPRLMSLAIMTNSSLGWDTIKKMVVAIFAFRAWPLYDSLPAGWKMADFAPYAGPEGMNPGGGWKDFLGHWTAAPKANSAISGSASRQYSQPGTPSTPNTPSQTANAVESLSISDGEWEIYEDCGNPMLAWDGVEQGMRLRTGAIPWMTPDGRWEYTFVVDGLQLAIRMCSDSPATHGSSDVVHIVRPLHGVEDRWIELVQDKVTILRRA